ncbi:MAG: class I SAM-dependent methyltransferase [Desulfuromonadales bacterium]|nr:class I SAM-dependent methyltransferase [Desulfuromonadales bacterium]
MEMISRQCPVCGSSDTSRVFAEANFEFGRLDSFAFASRKMPEYMHYRLLDCPTCDLLYANPLPSENYMAAGYGEAAFDSGIEAHYAAKTYAEVLADFIERLPDRHGTLDIGTGDGAFLERLLESGFDGVLGVEPSRAPIAAARDDIRPLIREGIFHDADFEPGSFSLVTCFQTLEHLHDPLVMVCAVEKLLKPGGAAFFICHNRRALSARLLGRKSPIFDIEHLQLFSPQSVRYLLEKAGFSDIRVMPIANRYPLNYWLRLLPFPLGAKHTLIAALDRMGIGRVTVAMSVGNIAVVGFKRLRVEG